VAIVPDKRAFHVRNDELTGDMASYHHRKEKHRVWKVHHRLHRCCESNSIPLISFRHALSDCPDPRNPPIVPPLGKFRAVLQIRVLPMLPYHGTLLSNTPTSTIIHGLSPHLREEGNNYVNVLPGHVGRREKHPLHYHWAQRLVRCFLAQNFVLCALFTLLSPHRRKCLVIQRMCR
jgi:hypothetical protein